MSVATAATSTKHQIRASLARWDGRLDPSLVPLFRDFVNHTVSRLRGPFLAHHHARQILEYLETAFLFALVRQPEQVIVEVRHTPQRGIYALSCMLDQPFIVDTIRLFLRRSEADYIAGFNLLFTATRDADGRLVSVGTEEGVQESLVLMEAEAGTLTDLGEATRLLAYNLELARAMVTDFKPMTRVIERMVEKYEVRADRYPEQAAVWRETAAFLRWLLGENFVFMGMDGVEPLGIQRLSGPVMSGPQGGWPPPHDPETVRVRKSHIESPIHRAGRIDEILIAVPDSEDPTQDYELFVRGMFTYRAVTQPCRQVPILRGILASILDNQESRPGSYRYKGIANAFDSLPTEFLFTASRQAIADTLDLVFESEQQQEVAVTFLMTGSSSAFCLVAMPKEQFHDELRRQLEAYIVDRLKATYSDHGMFVGRYDTVLFYYYLTGLTAPTPDEIDELTTKMREIATPWLSRLWAALALELDEETADRLTDTYGRAFPDEYTRITPAPRAVQDIVRLEMLSGEQNLVADVFEDDAGVLNLRLYETGDLYLSDILPVLDNFGLVVIESYATKVRSRGGGLYMDTFRLVGAKGVPRTEFRRRKELLERAIEAVFSGHIASDPLNQLVLAAGLSWEEVDVIRGYTRYSRQLRLGLSVVRVNEVLLSNPALCVELVRLFHARFDPDLPGDRAARIAEALEAVDDSLRLIFAHDDDLMFGTLRELVLATVRTNYYRTDRVLHYLSFKLDPAEIQLMGTNRPFREIYVHNKDVEGVHLRFGPVARGGLRWSDRDDYRTEILGLANTQVVKNVVIVPVGAKGGFYLKNASRDPGRRRQEADLHYQTFIRGLLDLTDNARGGTITSPPRVVCHDASDPYLVVAADKGTAHLSDTANALSHEYGFWLGDAFASGGSHGYDHKKVAITARGAWVLVRRHMNELGMDPYTQPFTCVGIGDMSGDVFGNGLIETPQTRLLAAFNHAHIFLDPDPDPKRSFDERKRLFDAGRGGGWGSYDKSVISEGGGVYERAAKSVPLTPQARAMLGIDAEEARPEDVVRRILQLEVDLLWNGGIGTYVKASWETHADADDRSNDAVRVSATELRCRMVGEGGNLGMTPEARIEAALAGVRLNTDFIDNSGGVDLSDHEVNLKILLDRVVERGEMTLDARNALLESMTDEVAQLVLADNDAHGRQLSRDEVRSRENVFVFGRAIAFVERNSGQQRASLHLPDDKELTRRAELGLGLTRPELAILSSWLKKFVYQELMDGEPRKLPGYNDYLVGYFPSTIRKKFKKDVRDHMLADEIAMTVLTNRIVCDSGAAFFPTAIETTGRPVHEIAAAYLKAQALSRAEQLRGSLEELRSKVPLVELYRVWITVDAGTRQVANYWLAARQRLPTDAEFKDMQSSVDAIYDLQAQDVHRKDQALADALAKAGIPQGVARSVLQAKYLNNALMVWAEAQRGGSDLKETVIQHLAVARASRLQQVLDDLSTRSASGQWEPIALNTLHHRFNKLLRTLVSLTPRMVDGQTVDQLEPRLASGVLKPVREQVDELLDGEGPPSLATLLVLEERVEGAVRRLER